MTNFFTWTLHPILKGQANGHANIQDKLSDFIVFQKMLLYQPRGFHLGILIDYGDAQKFLIHSICSLPESLVNRF